MADTTENGSATRTLVTKWLTKTNWQPGELIDWLQGYDMPPVGHDEEPYVWLLRGLPEADERHEAEKEFAKRVAVLLLDEPDVKRPGKRADQVLYNLFMLGAGLSCPDELAVPLYEIYERG